MFWSKKEKVYPLRTTNVLQRFPGKLLITGFVFFTLHVCLMMTLQERLELGGASKGTAIHPLGAISNFLSVYLLRNLTVDQSLVRGTERHPAIVFQKAVMFYLNTCLFLAHLVEHHVWTVSACPVKSFPFIWRKGKNNTPWCLEEVWLVGCRNF